MAYSNNNEASDLIARSVSHDEIAATDYSAELHTALVAECDDWTEGNDVTDYWGTSADGAEWRVELRTEVVS